MTNFTATHIIHYRGKDRAGPHPRSIPVHLIDGACYTRAEWDSETSADWEYDGRMLTFQGARMPAWLHKV